MKTLALYVAMYSMLYLMCVFTMLVASMPFEDIKALTPYFWLSVLICYPVFLKVKKIL